MSFADNLSFLRERAAMTQEELSERLDVSRQSVSKWESGGTYPEMTKLIALCDLFHTDLDTLTRGDVRSAPSRDDRWSDPAQDVTGYDRHMDWYARMIAGATGLILLGMGGMFALLALFTHWGAALAVLLIAVAFSVVLYIMAGTAHVDFRRRHPTIPPIYSEEELTDARRRNTAWIAGGVAAILLSVAMPLLLGQWSSTLFGWKGGLAVFFFDLAVAVAALIYGGMQMWKYDLPGRKDA